MRKTRLAELRHLVCLFLGLTVLGLVPAAAAMKAGPLPERWVAPESDWLVHIDAQRLSQAEALRPVFDALAASTWGASLTEMGIDARMDLTCITMFGTITRGPEARGETTTILQGGARLRKAIQKHVSTHDGYTLVLPKALTSGGSGISAWTIDGLAVHVALVPVDTPASTTGQAERASDDETDRKLVAILSDNSDRLQACITQIIGKHKKPPPEPAEPGSSSVQTTRAPSAEPDAEPIGLLACEDGSVIHIVARNLHQSHPPPKSALLASASMLTGHLGYRTQDDQLVVFAGLEIEGQPDADIQSMVRSLDHMVEFWTNRTVELSEQDAALLEMLPLLRGCRVTSVGQVVHLEMERKLVNGEVGRENPVLTRKPRGRGTPELPSKDR